MTDVQTPDKKPRKTKKAWGERRVHEDVTLPSGMVVDIRLPNLNKLLKSGEIPNPLADAAIEFANAQSQQVTREVLENSFDFACWIVPRTVVAPEITQEDVENDLVPPEDLDMLAGFIARTLDMDAVGHHLGGLESNEAFRKFRGITDLDSVLQGV
jgi:hypothetical protein